MLIGKLGFHFAPYAHAVALTLLVDRTTWRAHVEVVATTPGLIPVVKGNGYGFGRPRLLDECRRLGLTDIAVGTVHELADVGPDQRAIVLTPCVGPADAARLAAAIAAGGLVVPTIGHRRDLVTLDGAGHRGPVVVKLRTSMQRYGTTPADTDELLGALAAAGRPIEAFAAHFPLDGPSAEHASALATWLPYLPVGATLHVSHIDGDDLALLAGHHRFRPRIGTALWHGAHKAGLHLRADVVDVHPVAAGERIGYRQVTVPGDGHVVLVTAGTGHGVHPLPDGRSPFHFARTRLALVEQPHMHTSMLHVPRDHPCPAPGDHVDVQRPLTQTWVDVVEER